MSYSVEALEREMPVKTFLRDCVDVERFLGDCQACENYAKRWSCPPEAAPYAGTTAPVRTERRAGTRRERAAPSNPLEAI